MTDVPKVYGAISKVVAAFAETGIAKTRKNQQQGYQFRGIDEVLNALSSKLVEANLVMLPVVESREQVERQAKSGGALFYTAVHVRFDLVSTEDGSMHSIRAWGEAMDAADKSTNKAMSAAYKYAALMCFCIPTEADNDADAHTHEVTPQARGYTRAQAEQRDERADRQVDPAYERAAARAKEIIGKYANAKGELSVHGLNVDPKIGEHVEWISRNFPALGQDIKEAIQEANARINKSLADPATAAPLNADAAKWPGPDWTQPDAPKTKETARA